MSANNNPADQAMSVEISVEISVIGVRAKTAPVRN